MDTKQAKVDRSSAEFRRGFVDGVIGKMIERRLGMALGRMASTDERAAAVKALRNVTLQEYAERCLAAEDIVQDDRKRFLAIIKGR